MNTKNYNRPLIPLILSLIAGIAAGAKLPGFLTIAGCFSILFSAIAVIAVIKKRKLKYSPVILFISIGYLLIQPHVDPVFSDSHIKSYAGQTKYGVTGVVESRPEKKNRKCRFVLSVETITGEDGVCRTVSGKIRVTVYGNKFFVKKGDRLALKSKIRLFRNFNNPGGFDYERFMAFQNIWGSAYASEKNIEITDPALFSPVNAAQDSVIRLIDDSTIETNTKGVLKALIVGDKQWILPELREAFNRTGTGHLLAISGLHIGIVAAVSFWCFCYFLSFSQNFLWNGKILKYAGLMALMPVMAYGVIAGMSPSTQRAVIMVTVMLLAYSCRADYDIINSIALAAMVILIVSPVSLFTISFQLSFTAVFSIAVGISMIMKKDAVEEDRENLNKIWPAVKKKMASYILVSLFAFAGTLPVVIFYFNQISIIGLAANLILIPLVGFIVVPIGLMAAFINPISSTLGYVLINVSGFALEKALLIIRGLSQLPFASVKVITPSMIEMICYYSLFFLILSFLAKDKVLKKNQMRLKIVFGVILFVVIADISFWTHKRFFHNSFIVTALDVGQGSSTLLEFPDGKCMLIDGGGFNDNTAFDVGERIIAPLLWRKKIKTVDTVVLTHPESDHLNGLLYILKHFNVKEVWSNGQKRLLKGYKEFENIIAERNIGHQPYENMKRESVVGGVRLKIIYPPVGFRGKQAFEKWRTTNNSSLVMRAEYKDVSFLFSGDIMKKAEAELVKIIGDDLKSTVLFVPHHGSNTSSTATFLRRVAPDYAVISAGWENRFKMPHEPVLKRLNEAGSQIFRTDINGATAISVSEEPFKIDSAIKF